MDGLIGILGGGLIPGLPGGAWAHFNSPGPATGTDSWKDGLRGAASLPALLPVVCHSPSSATWVWVSGATNVGPLELVERVPTQSSTIHIGQKW